MHRVLWTPRQDKPPLNNAISLYTNPHAMENYINNEMIHYAYNIVEHCMAEYYTHNVLAVTAHR